MGIFQLLPNWVEPTLRFLCSIFLTLQWIVKIKLCIKIEKQLFPDPYFSLGSSVQSLSHVWLFTTPWTAACQASLSITNSWSLLKLMFTESVMPFNHLILCYPLLLLPSVFDKISLSQWVSYLHQVTKVLELQLQHQSFQWIYRTDLL